MNKDQTALLGKSYKTASAAKCEVYAIASTLAGKRLEVLVYNEAALAELEAMPDLQVGVLLLCDWGADVSVELMQAANVAPNISLPGELEIH